MPSIDGRDVVQVFLFNFDFALYQSLRPLPCLFTVDLEVIVTDTEGVQTNLCPISVQVLPLLEVEASVEEML